MPLVLGFLLVILRLLFGVFWLLAGINKVKDEWMTSPILENIFLQRLTELPPDSFSVFYLTKFAIPLYQPIGWFITIGEIYSAIGLLIGLTTRSSAIISLFILLNFAIGGSSSSTSRGLRLPEAFQEAVQTSFPTYDEHPHLDLIEHLKTQYD